MTGEGGMVLAKNERDAARIMTLALHGMSRDAWKRFSDEGYRHYTVEEAGFKYPHAARIGRQTVSIPLSAKLSDEDVDDVIAAVQRCLAPR